VSKADLIPLTELDEKRANPMIWEGEEQPQGVFLGGAPDDDPLALLGTPPMVLPPQPRLPDDFEATPALRDWLRQLRSLLDRAGRDPSAVGHLPTAELDAVSRQAITEILGEGEVAGSVTLDGVRHDLQESVLTGVWQVRDDTGRCMVEVGPVPAVVTRAAASLRPAPLRLPEPTGAVMNGAAILAEISDRAANWQGGDNHVINFTLLPMTEEDHELLIRVLGRAELSLTSGGFGDCRIMASTVRHVWAVQYVNAMGHTILDTIEIGDVPRAACAGREDFEDSSERLGEILEAYGL
jgi:hydrogenase-1 operon protein HyaF